MNERRRTLRWLSLTFACNFIAWFAIVLLIGGDAPSGQVMDGRYFVGSRGGALTEVGKQTYYFSLWHSYVTWGSAALALLGGLLFGQKR